MAGFLIQKVNKNFKIIIEESKQANLSTMEKLEMFEKLSKEGKIPKNKLDRFRFHVEKNNKNWLNIS